MLIKVPMTEVVLIFPTTRDPNKLYTIEFFNRKRYLLLSVNYFTEKVHPLQVLHTHLPAQLYGPNRILARVAKPRQAARTCAA